MNPFQPSCNVRDCSQTVTTRGRCAQHALDAQRELMSLPYEINNRLRYAGLGLNEHSTLDDVRRVRARIPDVRGIGRVALATIDAWLAGDVDNITRHRPAYPRRSPGSGGESKSFTR